MIMSVKYTFLYGLDSYTSYTAYNASKVSVHDLFAQTYYFKDPCRLIRLYRGDTHLCSDLNDTVKYSRVIVFDSGMIVLIKNALIYHLCNALMCKIRIDRTCTESEEKRHGSYISGFCGFYNY